MYKQMKITSMLDFESIVQSEQALIAYFSHDECSVCKVLKPKIEDLINNDFPLMKFIYIDVKQQPDIAAQNSVFVVPTIICYVQENENFRYSRNLSIGELTERIERFYKMLFTE